MFCQHPKHILIDDRCACGLYRLVNGVPEAIYPDHPERYGYVLYEYEPSYDDLPLFSQRKQGE